MGRSCLVWLVVVVVGVISPVSAMADDAAKARAAFDEGRELFHAKKYVEAADAFRRAYELKKTWKLFFNIAQCEAGAKRYGMAVEAFGRYLAEGGDEVSDDRLEETIAEIKRLKALSGMLVVTAPDGAVVSVDGVEQGTVPLMSPVMVAAGVPHTVEIKLDGQLIFSQSLRLINEEKRSIRAVPPDPQEAASPQPEAVEPPSEPASEDKQMPMPEETDEGNRPSPLFWSGFGVTLATGIAAGVLWGVAVGHKDDYEGYQDEFAALDVTAPEYLDETDRLDRKSRESKDELETYNAAAIAVTAVSAAVLAGTIAVLAMDLTGDDDESEKKTSFTVTPSGLAVRF